MEKERFIETGKSSFFGDYVYDRIVPAGHFLRKLKEIILWERFTQRLIKLYKGEGIVGRPPFDPASQGITFRPQGSFHGYRIRCQSERFTPPSKGPGKVHSLFSKRR